MEKIDAVITWVDGADPNYQRKLNKHLQDRNVIRKQYLQAHEINFCIASIIKYAPFVRKVFVVTDGQLPNLDNIKNFVSLDKVEFVDHKEIFRDHKEFLPTFNIRSIDALLYQIKNLSDKFIYFNDDMFIVKKTSPEDWFVNEKAVLLGKWSKTYNKQPIKSISQQIKKLLKLRPSFNAAQSKAANIAGFKNKYFKSYHCGRPQIKSIIEEFYDKNPHILTEQIKYKFRDNQQFMPYSLCWHLLIQKDLNIESSYNMLIEINKAKNLSANKMSEILKKIELDDKIKFLNIQDLNLAKYDTLKSFQNWFISKLSQKSKST